MHTIFAILLTLWLGQTAGNSQSDGELILLEPRSATSRPAPPPAPIPSATNKSEPRTTPTPPSLAAAPRADRTLAQVPAVNPDSIGDWMVDLARHHGHLLGRTEPRKASMRVLALLEGAQSVAPDNAQAAFWSFDILSRLGRTDSALAALKTYVRLNKSDDAARIRLTDLEMAGRQTAQERGDYLKKQLGETGLSRIVESDLRTRLAEYHYENGENDVAGEQIARALRLNPMNVAARRIGYELFGETEPALQRVELALQMVSANPTQSNLIWDLAEFLDQLSMHKEAQTFYTRAIEVHEAGSKGPVPPTFYAKLAMSYASSGDYPAAIKAAEQSIKQSPQFNMARIIKAYALRKSGDTQAADQEIEFAQTSYEARIAEVTQSGKADEAAEIAWFYAYHKPDKVKALSLAKVAMASKDAGSLAHLANGYALHANDLTDEAIAELEPLAEVDQFAALELAKIYAEKNQPARARTLLAKAATLQYSGVAYEAISDQMKELGETPAPVPDRKPLKEAVAQLNQRMFEFIRRPGEFLEFSLRFADAEPAPSAPIRVVLKLKNKSPFAITFGEGFMVRPLAAISAKVGEAEPAMFGSYLQVMLNERPVLWPGDSFEKITTIDIGPIRDYLTQTIGREQAIELTALLDPIYQDEHLVAGPGTIIAAPVTTRRPGLDLTTTGIAAIINRSGSADAGVRAATADAVGAILATAGGKFGGIPGGVDTVKLRTTLATLLADPNLLVKAHALVAAGGSALDDATTVAAAPAIQDSRTAIRLLAVRLFAERQGGKFSKALDALATSDTDRSVRMMARSYLNDSQTASGALGD